MVTWKVHGVVGEEASGCNEFLIAATTYLIKDTGVMKPFLKIFKTRTGQQGPQRPAVPAATSQESSGLEANSDEHFPGDAEA